MASATSFGDANSGLQAGTINGPVHSNIHHYASLERAETLPNPTAMIPFRRDADFVRRQMILDQIDKKCAVPGSWTALVGFGGVGKSQLAIEYAYQTRDRSLETWVFWVHASNVARFEQSFREIANCVKIYGRQNPTANIFQLVSDWLRDDRKGRWVLILDNVDDATFLVETRSTSQEGQTNGIDRDSLPPLVSYLPQGLIGSYLVTSRSKTEVLKLVEERDIIKINPMSEPEALLLLENKRGKQDDGENLAELAEALEFMPLAIVQAAAYITQRAPRYSVQQYIQDFRKNDRKKINLLNHDGGQLRRDWDAKNSIINTWQISFEHISSIRPSAANLLSLMSFCDRQGIPETLLRNLSERNDRRQDEHETNKGKSIKSGAGHSDDDDDEEDDTSLFSDCDGFEEDVLTLRNYSFISTSNGTTFEMHSLVQLATRKWLEVHGQQEKWRSQFIRNLDAELPSGEYKNWSLWQVLFPHAKIAAAQQPGELESLRKWASILYKAASFAYQMGDGPKTEKMSIQSLQIRKRLLGEEHVDTLRSVAMLSNAYELQGLWNNKEKFDAQLLDTRKRVLGQKHPDTLASTSHLAMTYLFQGRYKDAEDLQLQVLNIRKKMLGQEHPNTLASMGSLALTYWRQGRYKNAEDLQIQTLNIDRKILGQEHPHTLRSMNNLALTYWHQGRYKDAEDLAIQASNTCKKVLGQEHPDTLKSMSNLASIYACQKHYKDAEALEIQMLNIRRKVLGQEHPDTLRNISNLASTYQRQGRYKDAEDLETQMLTTSKTVLGQEHPDTLLAMYNLAWTWKLQERDAKALELMSSCLQMSMEQLGVDHPQTLSSKSSYTKWINEG